MFGRMSLRYLSHSQEFIITVFMIGFETGNCSKIISIFVDVRKFLVSDFIIEKFALFYRDMMSAIL